MKFIELLSYILNYNTFNKIDSIKGLLISFSINRKLKKVDGLARFKSPIKVQGLNNISIGKNFTSGKGLRLQAISKYENYFYSPEIIIGDNVTINPNCQIAAIDKIVIGNNVLIASYVFISDHSHGSIIFDDLDEIPAKRKLDSKGPIMIGDNSWIGQGVSILSNVKIGKNVIIGANSIVTKDLPDNCIAVGSPAKIIRTF